jgi:hypothetical protein
MKPLNQLRSSNLARYVEVYHFPPLFLGIFPSLNLLTDGSRILLLPVKRFSDGKMPKKSGGKW